MFSLEKCKTKEDRRKLASELFHKELGEKSTDQDWLADWCVSNIERSLDLIHSHPSQIWIDRLWDDLRTEVIRYKELHADLTNDGAKLTDYNIRVEDIRSEDTDSTYFKDLV